MGKGDWFVKGFAARLTGMSPGISSDFNASRLVFAD
jgi:hypothetical protein